MNTTMWNNWVYINEICCNYDLLANSFSWKYNWLHLVCDGLFQQMDCVQGNITAPNQNVGIFQQERQKSSRIWHGIHLNSACSFQLEMSYQFTISFCCKCCCSCWKWLIYAGGKLAGSYWNSLLGHKKQLDSCQIYKV